MGFYKIFGNKSTKLGDEHTVKINVEMLPLIPWATPPGPPPYSKRLKHLISLANQEPERA